MSPSCPQLTSALSCRRRRGDGPALWQVPAGAFTAGTSLANDAGMEVLTPARGIERRRAADALCRIGMIVDRQAMGWGTLAQRRVTKEPVEKVAGACSARPGRARPLRARQPSGDPRQRGRGLDRLGNHSAQGGAARGLVRSPGPGRREVALLPPAGVVRSGTEHAWLNCLEGLSRAFRTSAVMLGAGALPRIKAGWCQTGTGTGPARKGREAKAE